MRPTVDEITTAVRDFTRSRSYREAEKRLDFWAVVLLGPERRIPRHFGDNEGAWPVRVGTTRDPKAYAERADYEAGHTVAYVPLAWVWTLSQRHALRLKARLDELLLGSAEEHRMRHAWRDINDPEVDWPVLLEDAVSQWPEEIEVFGDESKVMRTMREARRGRGR